MRLHFIIINLIYRGVVFQKLLNYLTIGLNTKGIYLLNHSPSSIFKRVQYKVLNYKLSRYFKSELVGVNDSRLKINLDKFQHSSEYEIRFLISYLIFNGYLIESKIVLRGYLDRLQKNDFKMSNNYINQLSQLNIWGCNEIESDRLLSKIKFKALFPSKYLDLIHDIYVNTGKVGEYKKNYTMVDRQYATLVNNKRIAIVGPKVDPMLPSASMEEILKYDLVIVPTYIASNYQNSLLKVNISYYNYQNQNLINENNEIVNGLDYIVLKGNNLLSFNKNIKSREAKMSLFPWITGAPNMTQIILYDLLYFSPAEIKIFGIDFFAGENPYFSGYPSKVDDSIRMSFAEHNPLANLKFVQHLLKQKHISIDLMGQRVVDMSDDQYLDVIKQRYYNYEDIT